MHVSKGNKHRGANNSSVRSTRGPPPVTEQFPELHEDATEPPPYHSQATGSAPPVFTIGGSEEHEDMGQPVAPRVLGTDRYYHPASFPGYTAVQLIQGGERQGLLPRARRQQRRQGSCMGRCCRVLCTCACFLAGVVVVAGLLCGAFLLSRQIIGGDWRCRDFVPYSDQRFAYDSQFVIESGATLTDVHLVGDLGVRAVIEASVGRHVGVEHIDGVLRIRGNSPDSWWWWWQESGCVRATLYVGKPRNSTELKSLDITTTAGSGTLTALDVGAYPVDRVKVAMRNGRVQLHDLSVRGSLHLSMSNGLINATNVRVGGSLELSAPNSPIDLVNITAANTVSVQASNAHINAISLRSSYAHLRTSNGRVSLGGVDVGDNLLVHTSNGRIEGEARAAFFYASTSNAAVRLGLGGRLRVVVVDSSNGAIDVKASGFSGTFDVNTSNSRAMVTGRGSIEFMESGVAHKRGVYGGDQGKGNITLDTRNGRVDLQFV